MILGESSQEIKDKTAPEVGLAIASNRPIPVTGGMPESDGRTPEFLGVF
jgi:hypothetical protein